MSNKKKGLMIFFSIIGVLACVFAGLLLWVKFYYIDAIDWDKDFQVEVSPESTLEELTYEDDDSIKNIALFGLDAKRTDSGRSDAIIILTVDKKNDKIKLTSIARDSYVEIRRAGKNGGYIMHDKINHAYSYGKAKLAVETLNLNFDLNIKDYVAVNFLQFVEIIDAIGGVTIDVDKSELKVTNNYIRSINSTGIPCKELTQAGPQLLTGGQALGYARNRYTGGELQRGNRHKEVLMIVYEKLKTQDILTMLNVLKIVCSNCATSLDEKEILDIALWAISKKPAIESIGLPDNDCNMKKGNNAFIDGIWYNIYDLDIAAEKLHAFINKP